MIQAANNLALGDPAGGTVVNGIGVLLLENAHITNEVLTLNSTNPNGALQDDSTGDWIGPITLSTDVVIEASSLLQLGGVISGPGGFTKISLSTLRMIGTGVNTYGGTTIVNAGTLELSRNAFDASIPGDLVIGDGVGSDVVRNLVQNQIANTSHVTINSGGLFDGNSLVEGIGSLELTGGAVQTGAGTLVLFHGGVTANSSSIIATISGNLDLATSVATFDVTSGAASPELLVSAAISGGGITKIGTGNLQLTGANNYSGLTTISNGFIEVASATALGLTNAGTVLENSGSLLIEGVSVVNEALTNNSASAQVQSTGIAGWSGRVVLNAQLDIATFGSLGTLDLSGVISGSGALTKSQIGTLIYSGANANTYAGITTVSSGTLLLNKSPADGAVPGDLVINGTVRLGASEQIADSADMLINASGLFDTSTFFERIDTLRGRGSVTFGVSGWIEVGLNNGSSTFDGVMSGAGFALGYTVGKFGSGTFTMNGDNTFTAGATRVLDNGKLIVNGSQPQVPAIVDSTATLGGSGTVGNITANGNVAPGSSPGILTSSNVVFTSTGDYFVELTGPIAGTGYDQLNVRGTNVLGNAVLHVTPAFTTPVAIGQTFTILNNDLGDAITGTFSGLAEGAGITVNGFSFKISYVGGTGNDVVLTLTNVPLAQAGSSVNLGNGNGTIDPNECNYLNVVITNKTGTPMTGISATLLSTTPNLAVTQPFSAYDNVPASGSGTNTVPFQISTSPSFVCGSNVTLNLTVTTSSHGTFTTPIVLTSGGPSAVPSRYDNGVVISIPDVGSIDSTNVVSGFVGPLQKVVVAMYLTHTFDSDLTNISLIAPDGTTVLLSSANGGGGQNYGNNCSPDASRTTFDDAAGTAITSGAAPFVGTFRPQSPLSAYIGNGTPNGNWRLHIADGFGGSLGTLRCWSLFLYGSVCTPGGGLCELCPNVTITGATGLATPTQTNFLTFNGVASTCGVPKACPGTSVGGPFPSDNYTFRNGPSDACVTVTVENDSPTVQMLATVYSGSYNLANPDKCVNYLADGGNIISSVNMIQTFSFNVLSNATFVVNIIANTTASTAPYRLTVSGGDCRPVLNITPVDANNVQLDWTTAAAGFGLESTNSLTGSGANWPPVTNVPVVINSRFLVTNNAAIGNQFYQLRKP
jgi:autotransporter-associated beta strand protein